MLQNLHLLLLTFGFVPTWSYHCEAVNCKLQLTPIPCPSDCDECSNEKVECICDDSGACVDHNPACPLGFLHTVQKNSSGWGGIFSACSKNVCVEMQRHTNGKCIRCKEGFRPIANTTQCIRYTCPVESSPVATWSTVQLGDFFRCEKETSSCSDMLGHWLETERITGKSVCQVLSNTAISVPSGCWLLARGLLEELCTPKFPSVEWCISKLRLLWTTLLVKLRKIFITVLIITLISLAGGALGLERYAQRGLRRKSGEVEKREGKHIRARNLYSNEC